MRAVVFEQFGEPSQVLAVQQLPEPETPRGFVGVRMKLAPINPADLSTVRGTYGKRPELPTSPGYEGVGVVVSANAGLYGRFLQGKRVAVLNAPNGTWREQLVINPKQVIPLPDAVPDEQAASFFINPATAYLLTRQIHSIQPGEWLLQSAANSEVGRMVIRLGKTFGFRTINLVRQAAQVDELLSLGADQVLVFDPSRDSPADLQLRVAGIVGQAGIKSAIDPIGGPTGSALVRCLGPGGKLIVYGTLSGEPLSFSSRELMTQSASIEGFWLSNHMSRRSLLGKLKLIRELTRLTRQGVFQSRIDAVYPVDQLREALRAVERPQRVGKVLLNLE